MKNWIGSSDRLREEGLVLPVALLLLIVLTIAAVASMRGGAMQERMAVGQIQMHSSFLQSEQAAWDAAACIRSKYIDGDGQFFTSPPEPADVIEECGETDLAHGAVITHSEQPWRYNVIAAREFRDTGAVRPVVLEVITPGGGGPSLPSLAAYACFGANCALNPAPAQASPTADGTNRLAPDIGERCRIQGQHRPAENKEASDAPGVIMPHPEADLVGVDDGDWDRAGGADGDPPYIIHDDEDTWSDWWSKYRDARSDVPETPEAYIDQLVFPYKGLETFDGTLQDGATSDPVWVAGPGDVIDISGGNSTVFGTIILDGGRLEMQGNQCFVGSVIFLNGGEMVAMDGTPAVVGSVIGYAGDEPDDPVINPSLNGNPSFYFSDDALEIARIISGSDVFEIARWRSPVELDLTALGYFE